MGLNILLLNMFSYPDLEKGVMNRNINFFRIFQSRGDVQSIMAVDYLPFSLKKFIKSAFYFFFRKVSGEVVYKDLTSRLVKITNRSGSAEVYIYSCIDYFFNHHTCLKKINNLWGKYCARSGKKVLWSCLPICAEYFPEIKYDLNVFDAIDNWLEHPSYAPYKHLLDINYRRIAQKADLVFTVNDNVADFFRLLGREKDVYAVENGVDYNFFASDIAHEDLDLKNIPKPWIGYFGIVESRIDGDLMAYLAEHHPEKSFLFVGPIWPVFLRQIRPDLSAIKKMKKYKNIYFLGPRPYQLAPFYIKQFDVAILPHQINQFVKSNSSLKILEYLACGKPIVSIPSAGAEKLGHLLYLAATYPEFSERINAALLEKDDQIVEKRRGYAQGLDWSKKIDFIIEKIISFK